MIISTAQYSVDGTPVKIVSANEVARVVYLNCKSNEDIYIGSSNTVSTTTGLFHSKSAPTLQVQIDANDELWCLAATGTHTVTVMTVTQ